MTDVAEPEIRRTNLASTVLYLKCLGIHDILSFPFLDPPMEASLLDALCLLHYLEALDEDGRITPLGKRMSEFPVDPPLARMLIAASELQCGKTAIIIASMLSVENVFLNNNHNNKGTLFFLFSLSFSLSHILTKE